MAVPDFLGQDVHEADAVIDRALADIVRRQEAVNVVGAQIGDHFRRRYRAQLHVGIGIEPVLGEIVAQQIIVHRIVEGNGELHALPILWVALVLVLDGERDPLPVDVLDRGHGKRDRLCAQAQCDRNRHRRQHVRGVVFLVDGLVADHGPAGGLDDLDVKAVLGVEAERCRHDDRGCAGDRDEADLEILLFQRPAFGKGLGRGLQREELRQCGDGRRCPHRFQERAARGILRKHRPHYGGGDHALVALFHALCLVLDLIATQRPLGMVVLGA